MSLPSAAITIIFKRQHLCKKLADYKILLDTYQNQHWSIKRIIMKKLLKDKKRKRKFRQHGLRGIKKFWWLWKISDYNTSFPQAKIWWCQVSMMLSYLERRLTCSELFSKLAQNHISTSEAAFKTNSKLFKLLSTPGEPGLDQLTSHLAPTHEVVSFDVFYEHGGFL